MRCEHIRAVRLGTSWAHVLAEIALVLQGTARVTVIVTDRILSMNGRLMN